MRHSPLNLTGRFLLTSVLAGAGVALTAGAADAQLPSLARPIWKLFGRLDSGQEAAANPGQQASSASNTPSAPAGQGAIATDSETSAAPAALLPPPSAQIAPQMVSASRQAVPEVVFGEPLPAAAPIDFSGEPQGDFVLPPDCVLPPLFGMSAKSVTIEPVAGTQSPMPWESQEHVSLVVRDETIGTVLAMIAEQHGLNIVTADQVTGSISVALKDVPLHEALNTILTSNGYTWNLHQNILVVSSLTGGTKLSPFAQGRQVRVFQLDFASASDVDRVVKGLLSPVGQSFLAETDSADKRRTREQLIVEDLPAYLDRIEAYVNQVDQAPRQVLIEAHILEVSLEGDLRHGVNLDALLQLTGSQVTVETVGFANENASPAFFIGINGTDLTGLIELILTTTDSKTLASPKVLALNGQQARIQIGSRLGYFVTTTTQTSTLQSVEFLDVGVVLHVTPLISHDGRILMSVKPEVSGGRINPDSGLPDEDTTEVETTIMLGDGQAMIIGGLIQEEDTETQSKIPYLGDLHVVGRLFQKRNVVRKRSEIIIALVPRIIPLSGDAYCREQVELAQAQTPLTVGPLHRVNRTAWEPLLPDARRNPIPVFGPTHYPSHR